MKAIPARTQGIVASGLMAIVVLGVFANMTFTGPESTIYELHYGLLTGDRDTVKGTVLQGTESGPARQLLAFVERLLGSGARYNVQNVDSRGREAVVVVIYSSPRFGVFGVQYVLYKSRNRWLVDADKTLGALAARGTN
jgi:hypothetical protein